MEGRFIAPWHNVYWYADSDSFQQGITAIEDAYHQKGIEDYVIVKFHFPDPSMSYTQYSALKSEDVDGLDVKKLRENEYIAYTAYFWLVTIVLDILGRRLLSRLKGQFSDLM